MKMLTDRYRAQVNGVQNSDAEGPLLDRRDVRDVGEATCENRYVAAEQSHRKSSGVS